MAPIRRCDWVTASIAELVEDANELCSAYRALEPWNWITRHQRIDRYGDSAQDLVGVENANGGGSEALVCYEGRFDNYFRAKFLSF